MSIVTCEFDSHLAHRKEADIIRCQPFSYPWIQVSESPGSGTDFVGDVGTLVHRVGRCCGEVPRYVDRSGGTFRDLCGDVDVRPIVGDRRTDLSVRSLGRIGNPLKCVDRDWPDLSD